MNLRKYGMVLGGILVIGLVITGSILIAKRQDGPMSQTSSKSPEPSVIQEAGKTSGLQKTFKAVRGEDYDKHFVPAMITNQQQVGALSHIAATKAQHAELRDFAAKAAATADANAKNLTAWKQQWNYADEADPNADHDTEEEAADIESSTRQLESQSGETVDKLYVIQMIDMYQQAVAITGPGAAQGSHTEVKALARTLTTQYNKDLAQLRKWQQAWGYHD